MRALALAVAMTLGMVVSGVAGVSAFNCPVVIKQAEDLVRKAEGKANAENRALIEEAKKFLAEAKGHHDHARTKRDHADAVRKAKFAIALAEEAIVLQTP